MGLTHLPHPPPPTCCGVLRTLSLCCWGRFWWDLQTWEDPVYNCWEKVSAPEIWYFAYLFLEPLSLRIPEAPETFSVFMQVLSADYFLRCPLLHTWTEALLCVKGQASWLFKFSLYFHNITVDIIFYFVLSFKVHCEFRGVYLACKLMSHIFNSQKEYINKYWWSAWTATFTMVNRSFQSILGCTLHWRIEDKKDLLKCIEIDVNIS